MHAFPQLNALNRVLNIPIRAFEALRMSHSRSNLSLRLWDNCDVTITHNPSTAALLLDALLIRALYHHLLASSLFVMAPFFNTEKVSVPSLGFSAFSSCFLPYFNGR